MKKTAIGHVLVAKKKANQTKKNKKIMIMTTIQAKLKEEKQADTTTYK